MTHVQRKRVGRTHDLAGRDPRHRKRCDGARAGNDARVGFSKRKACGQVRIGREAVARTEAFVRGGGHLVRVQNRGLVPNHEASLLKLFTTEMNQRIARTGMKVIGLYGSMGRGEAKAPRGGGFAGTFIRSIANTIEGVVLENA